MSDEGTVRLTDEVRSGSAELEQIAIVKGKVGLPTLWWGGRVSQLDPKDVAARHDMGRCPA